MAEPTVHTVPIPDIASYQAAYGPLAFGLLTTVMILLVVWFLFIRPQQEQIRRSEDARDRQLEQMERISNTNLEATRALSAAGAALSTATNDLRQLHTSMERTAARLERMEGKAA